MPADPVPLRPAGTRGDTLACQRINGAILVGGRSTRMGAPKALLPVGGLTLIEHVAVALAHVTRAIHLLGDGAAPTALVTLPRIGDAPDWSGPLAGVVGALERDPGAWWIVVGCDQPRLTCGALEWLLAQRTGDCVAVVPRGADGIARPLPGLYHGGLLSWLSAREGGSRAAGLRSVQRAPRVVAPQIPEPLLAAWESVNTPQQLHALRTQCSASENQEKKRDLQHFFGTAGRRADSP